MNRIGIAILACLLVATVTRGEQQPSSATDVAVSLVNAIVTSNLDGVMAVFADDATAFMPTASAATRLTGKPEIRQAFAALFQNASASAAPRRVSPRDLAVQSFGDVAIVTFHLDSPQPVGSDQRAVGRRTLILRRAGGVWSVVHLHASTLVTAAPQP
jgi:ketosteroid isomerase-like protein